MQDTEILFKFLETGQKEAQSQVPKNAMLGPKKTRNKDLIKEALKLYVQHVPYSQICKQIGIARRTMCLWVASRGWAEIRRQAEKKQDIKVANKVQEMKERHLKVTRLIYATVAQKIQKDEIEPSVSDAIRAMEHEAKLEIPEAYNPTTVVNTQVNTITSAESFTKLLQEAKKERDINNANK